MLTIEIRVNGRLVAGASVVNESPAGAKVCRYGVEAVERADPVVARENTDFHARFTIANHPRHQTVWALVSRVAEAALSRRRAGDDNHTPGAHRDGP